MPNSRRDLIRLAAIAATAVALPAFADTEPPLWTGLGSITHKVTTTNEGAQAYFDQGLRLAYAFNHGEAQRAFRKAQKLDPDCAMCFWGEALVLGPNINLPMQEDAAAPAYSAAQKAKSLAGKATAREQALIRAIVARYGNDPKAARAPFDKAYASAMAKVAAKYPDDDQIMTLYAEAVMDLSPWDYWKPGGREPNRQSREREWRYRLEQAAAAAAIFRPPPCRVARSWACREYRTI